MCYICEEIKKYIYLKTKIKQNYNEKHEKCKQSIIGCYMCVSDEFSCTVKDLVAIGRS